MEIPLHFLCIVDLGTTLVQSYQGALTSDGSKSFYIVGEMRLQFVHCLSSLLNFFPHYLVLVLHQYSLRTNH